MGGYTTDVRIALGTGYDTTTDSLQAIGDTLGSLPVSTGTVYYVTKTGNDSNAGNRQFPFLTINYAVSQAVAGDEVLVGAGVYAEDVDCDKAIRITFDVGAVLPGVASTCLTVSGAGAAIVGGSIGSSGKIGIKMDAAGSIVRTSIIAGTIGIQANAFTFIDSAAIANYSSKGFEVNARINVRDILITGDAVAATIGVHLQSGSSFSVLTGVHTVGNPTQGWKVDADVDNLGVYESSSGGADGKRVDGGWHNNWAGFMEQLGTQFHEHIYPIPDGNGAAGAAITITNSGGDEGGAADNQNYWGDVMVIVAPDAFTEWWRSHGLYATVGTANKEFIGDIYYTNNVYKTTRNGGNAWDQLETALTVTDASNFAVGDLVWIKSDEYTDGEIADVTDVTGPVITIQRDGEAVARAGIRWNHATNETMYVVWRDEDKDLDKMNFSVQADNTRGQNRVLWETPREIRTGGAMLARLQNPDDALAITLTMRAIVEH